MSKQRERRGPDPGEFEDPLKKYETPDHADEFERSLTEDPVAVIGHKPYVWVEPQTPVRDVLRLMAERNIACVVVVDAEQHPVGLLTELDVTTRIAPCYDETVQKPVSEVMTSNPVVVNETESPARVFNIMGTGSFRHVPVCDVSGKLTGVIGARRLIAYLEEHVG